MKVLEVPDYGNGIIKLKYSINNKKFTLNEIESKIKINPKLYKNRWPFKGFSLSKGVYLGEGWYPENDYFVISPVELNKKFKYFGANILHGIDELYNYTGKVNDNHVRIREIPTLEGKIIGKTFTGDKVIVLDRSPKKMKIESMNSYWYKIKKDELIGWMYGQFLEKE